MRVTGGSSEGIVPPHRWVLQEKIPNEFMNLDAPTIPSFESSKLKIRSKQGLTSSIQHFICFDSFLLLFEHKFEIF